LIAKFGRLTLLKNAVANLMRGSASALVALLLPPFLVRAMAPPEFAAWSLVLQLSAYAGFLDFGIQTAVGRFVAHANELRDTELRGRIVSTAMWRLAGSAALALALVGILAWQIPNLFREMPPGLYGDARLALLLVGGSTALGLPASVFIGIFVGLQRNEVPAAIIGGGRLVGAVAVLAVVARGGSLVSMAAALAGVNLLSYALQYWAVRRWAPEMRVQPRAMSRRAAREILAYCASLSIWSFATLLVQGVDTTVVGFFDFAAVGYYTVAASFITVILGMQNALFSALIPEAAILSARGDDARLGGLLTKATRYGMFALLATGLPLLVAARPILSLWVGPTYANGAAPLLQVLVVANVVRLSAVPYAMLLIGTGQQRLVTVTPLVEGFTNLIASVVGAYYLGALGVALGTLVGAVVATLCNVLYNMPRTRAIALDIPGYLRQGLGRPAMCALPALLFGVAGPLGAYDNPAVWAPTAVLALAASALCFWQVGLLPEERTRVRGLVGPRLSMVGK
jgi:O-antigen/teichoic acid export membrane protein